MIDLLALMLRIQEGLEYKLEDNYPEGPGSFAQFIQVVSKILHQITKHSS
jgi:hypothetical protein